MKRTKNKLFFLVILGLLLMSSRFIIASELTDPSLQQNADLQELNQKIENNKIKIENLKKAAEEYSDKIEEYKGLSASLKNQLSLLDNQIIKIELDAKTTQLQVDKTKLEIEAMNYQIDKQEAEISKEKLNLMEFLKLINQNDQKSYLEILILNDSFAEFFNQLNYLQEIQNDLQNIVERLKLLKSANETQKADKERQKKNLEKLKDDLLLKQDKLQGENKAKEILLFETKSSEILFQKLLVETKQRQNNIDADILNIEDTIKEKIKRLKGGSDSPKNTLQDWPLSVPHEITSYFHDPDYPFRSIFEHPAVDIRAKQGTPIAAPASGYVARAMDAGYGYSYIILIHDNSISTVYGHVSAIYVKEDTYVNQGDIIGLTGGLPGTKGAGNLSTGAHLHFEVRLNGIPVNPLEYLP